MPPELKINELIELGRFREAAAAIDRFSLTPSELRVPRAQLEAHVGTTRRARELAQRLLKENLGARERCQIGRAHV